MTYSYLLSTIIVVLTFHAHAGDITIFEVHKNIPLNNDEIVYKDYYISGGATDGIKKGMVLTVNRKSPIHDNLKNKSQGFLLNAMGRVQIIHVEQEFSIARLFAVQERDNAPLADLDGVMVGDFVDLATAHELKENMEKPTKKVSKREEKPEGEKDSASLIDKPKAAPATASAPVAPASIAPPAIGLPKAPSVDKPSL